MSRTMSTHKFCDRLETTISWGFDPKTQRVPDRGMGLKNVHQDVQQYLTLRAECGPLFGVRWVQKIDAAAQSLDGSVNP